MKIFENKQALSAFLNLRSNSKKDARKMTFKEINGVH